MSTAPADGYDAIISELREREYPMIQDGVYLDHAGSTLCSKTVMDSFAHEMTHTLFGNPHSASGPSQATAGRIDDTRSRLLGFLNADPSKYDVIFVANATAGVKLVVEALRCLPHGFNFAHHQACHTSVIGAREESSASICFDDAAAQRWLGGEEPFESSPWATLIAYSAQSHLNGRKYPLSWSKDLKANRSGSRSRTYTLLDAASFCATSPMNMNHPDFSADFTVLSLYKIFGFPDLGALIVSRDAEPVFDHRKYFGGGTVDTVVTGKEQWHASKTNFIHERLEDGTLPFHSIIALDVALRVHAQLFGSMEKICAHTSHLASRLVEELGSLHHGNGQPACVVYTDLRKDRWSLGTGPIVSLNLVNRQGAWVSLAEFDKLASLKKIHVRTGSVCSPGGVAEALSLEPWEIRRNYSAGLRCGGENDIIWGKPSGVIRVSFGAMSSMSDVQHFLDFLAEFYVDSTPSELVSISSNTIHSACQSEMRVGNVTVYPIKSCAGYSVPAGIAWGVRPEGLIWDREWCLLHRGSGQALSQKRFPQMALIRPLIHMGDGVLRISFRGQDVTVPLSDNPALYDDKPDQLSSRVCGENITAKTYASAEINDFFTTALGVPCVLARFPPGGRGPSARSSKLRSRSIVAEAVAAHRGRPPPGAFPFIPSPPDSDSEQHEPKQILLSNESPILMVNMASVDSLNRTIVSNGGQAVHESSFRPNIVVVGSGAAPSAYAEDAWTSATIGTQSFELLGGCQRCQMICVEQETGERRQEPFVTLAKTRRQDGGKVMFGVHMRHDPRGDHQGVSKEQQYPVIQVGDPVTVST